MRYAVILNGTVINLILWDGNEGTPPEDDDGSWLPWSEAAWPGHQVVPVPEDGNVGLGDSWSEGGGFVAQPPAPPHLLTAAEASTQKTSLIAFATTKIDPLQDMVDIGDASPDEEAELLAWKNYRIALTRVKSTTPGWPGAIVWPVMPS